MNRVDSHSYSDSSPDEDDTGRSSDEECSNFALSTKKRLGKINDCQIFTMSKLAKQKGTNTLDGEEELRTPCDSFNSKDTHRQPTVWWPYWVAQSFP